MQPYSPFFRFLCPEVSEGVKLRIPVLDNYPPKRMIDFAGEECIRYNPNRPFLDALEFEGYILSKNLRPALDKYLAKLSAYILKKFYIVHLHGAVGDCRSCHICRDLIPRMRSALQPSGSFFSHGLVFSEHVLVPALMLALRSCGRYMMSESWAREFDLLDQLCFLLEKAFPEERAVWDPLIQVFVRKSVEEIVEEMFSEERLEKEHVRALEKIFVGETHNMLLYALKKDVDEGWDFEIEDEENESGTSNEETF